MIVDALVEGPTDEAVARKIIAHCQHTFGVSYGKQGQSYIREKARGFDVLAQHGNPILVLVDFMDTGCDCPAAVPEEWLPARSKGTLLRVVVRELESWLLADAAGLAAYLGLPRAVVPSQPESVGDPKLALVNLARRSRRTRLRDSIVPYQGSSGQVGPGYVMAIEEYVARHWSVDAAAANAPSLARCLFRLREL